MHVSASAPFRFIGANFFPCLRLAKHYLVVPDPLHRRCFVGVVGIIALLLSCFVTYAFVEKYQLTNSFFYGRVEFSFIDRGYPELFGYMLELAASTIFLLFAVTHHKKCWLAWAGMMFVIFLDDAFKLHETIGHSYAAALNLAPVAGDLMGFATTGLLAVIFWGIGVINITHKEDFRAYLIFSVYFAVLIFFGVGVDAIHALFGENVSQTVFTLAEDGGELLTTAVIALSALGMWLRQRRDRVGAGIHLRSAVSKS